MIDGLLTSHLTSFSIGQWVDDNERLCAMEPLLRLKRFRLKQVHLAVACGVYGDVFLCCPFSHEVSWMRS